MDDQNSRDDAQLTAAAGRDRLDTPMGRLRDVVGPLVGLSDDVILTEDELLELVSRIVRRSGNTPGLSALTVDLGHPEDQRRADVEGVPPGFGAGVPPDAPKPATSITETASAHDQGVWKPVTRERIPS